MLSGVVTEMDGVTTQTEPVLPSGPAQAIR